MAAAVLTPVAVTATTTISDLVTGPGSTAEEHVIDVRVCNKTATAATYRLALATSDNATTVYRWYDFTIQPYDTRDLEVGLVIPNGWKLRHLAGTNSAIDVTATGVKRPTA